MVDFVIDVEKVKPDDFTKVSIFKKFHTRGAISISSLQVLVEGLSLTSFLFLSLRVIFSLLRLYRDLLST